MLSLVSKCDDTVRCIVTNLTEDGSGDLSDELIRGPPVMLDESYGSDDDAATDDWETWQPDPVDADPGRAVGREGRNGEGRRGQPDTGHSVTMTVFGNDDNAIFGMITVFKK